MGERLSSELPRGRAAWRGTAVFSAGRLLHSVGGVDLAASLSYFATLSLIPIVALMIMGIAVVFGDSEVIREELAEILVFYFPTSKEVIEGAIASILSASIAVGLLSVVSLMIGANGLISSASRTVSKVFGSEGGKILQTTLHRMLIAMVGSTYSYFPLA